MLFALRSAPPLDPAGCRECRAADVVGRGPFIAPKARLGFGLLAVGFGLLSRGVTRSFVAAFWSARASDCS